MHTVPRWRPSLWLARSLYLSSLLALSAGLIASCAPDDPAKPPPQEAPHVDAGAPDAPTETAAIAPTVGKSAKSPVDCEGAFALPAAFTGPKGLGGVGWTLADLKNDIAWGVPSELPNDWVTDVSDAHPSVRTRPDKAPEAGHCYKALVEGAAAGVLSNEPALAGVIGAMSAFGDRSAYYDELLRPIYEPPAYPLDADDALVGALRGLYEKPNAFPGAPAVPPWDKALAEGLAAAVAPYPKPLRQALARLVLSVGEAYDLKVLALEKADPTAVIDLFDRFLNEKYSSYGSLTRAIMSPAAPATLAAILAADPTIDLSKFYLAAQAVAGASEGVLLALAGQPPIDAPPLDLLTPHGRILVRTSAADDTYDADVLAGATIVVDAAGNDSYYGQFASTHALWLSASALVDVAGNDGYNPDVPALEDAASTSSAVLDKHSSFTEGAGLLGVGLLLDGAGDDDYRASAYGIGASAFGVGVVADYGGSDTYRNGIIGQGVGYLGMGLLLDASGDDHYKAYMVSQGVGRPSGHGLLLDMGGDDEYLSLYNDDPPELPSPGYKGFYLGQSGYSDAAGENHNLGFCQGVGMGYRYDWFTTPDANWVGGFGALLDLGSGKDVHYSDTLSMGQGFVYGFGLLYDGGGDDIYRSFWWAFGSGTHMGTGLMIEEGGSDDYFATRASATLGHDTGASWFIEKGGDDVYGGRLNFGKSLTNGLAFFLDLGGDDVYALPPDAAADPAYRGFGFVDDPIDFAKRAGIFMDLGGGNDTYQTARPEVKNGAAWVIAPVGPTADPAKHKGIGLDE